VSSTPAGTIVEMDNELEATIEYVAHSHHCDFKAAYWNRFAVVPFYKLRESLNSWEEVPDLEAAEIAISGSVKWDGCMNFEYWPNHGSLVHYCDPIDDSAKLHNLLRLIVIRCHELIPASIVDVEEMKKSSTKYRRVSL
jgi:hypothetical protein